MSDNAPPPPQPFESDPADDTIRLGGNDPGGQPVGGPGDGSGDGSRGRSRTPIAAAAVGTVLALVIGGGAYAFYQIDPMHLFRSGPQAAEAVPADALAYAAVDLDPAATQKIEALRFLNHFPGFQDVADITDERDDIRKTILTDAIDSLGCDGVSYDDTIEPWLGDKFGFAAMPPATGSDPEPLVAIEVTDRDMASDGVDALVACAQDSGESTDDFGYAFNGDYLLIASSQRLAERYASDASDASLADDSDFRADMDAVGDTGVASAWVDIAGLIDLAPADAFDSGLGPTADEQGMIDLIKSKYSRAAITLWFSSDHVDVVSAVRSDDPIDIEHGDNEVVDLPDSTVFAVSMAGGGDAVAKSWDETIKAARTVDAQIDVELKKFESQTGFSLPTDLETLLGDNLLFAVDRDGLDPQTIGRAGPASINAGARFTGDRDRLDALYDKITNLMSDVTGEQIPFSKADFDRGLAIASNDAYAQALADLDGNLGDSKNFQSVIDDPADQDVVMFFNWDLIEDEVIDALGQFGAGSSKFVDNVRPLRAFGITADTQGDYAVSHLVVSVD
jgi:Protein of unknown function (DUF3352)